MNADRWRRIEDLFHRAQSLPEASRHSWLMAEAGGDAALMDEVQALLRADARSSLVLDAPPAGALPPGLRIGPYALKTIIGRGGMATVYRAARADRQFDKEVAVKVVNEGFAGELAGARVQRERRILAQLEHPHITRLIDAGLTDFGQPYLVMELIEGVTVDMWMRDGPRAFDARLDLWLKIADAVSYAHRKLIIHRDLKPSNVMVTADGEPKLLDFGIARLITDEAAAPATVTQHYTPRYASPEQLRGESIGTAADVYGLGLLLYELCTGEHPLGDASNPDRTPAAAAARPRDGRPGVPADLAAILGMALRQEPERRYRTVDEFAADVRRYRRGLPVSAQPESVAYRVRRFVGRHRAGVAITTLVTLALAALALVAWRQSREALREHARAEQVSRYLLNALGAAPYEPDWTLMNRGADVRVSELADVLAARVDGEKTLDPEVEASLRYVLATIYTQLGDVVRLQPQLVRAGELARRLYARSDIRRAGVELLEGNLAVALGRFAEAEQQMRELQPHVGRLPPYIAATAGGYIATAEWRLGRLDEAERTFNDNIRRLGAAYGTRFPLIANLRGNLALVFLERGQFEAAASELDQAIAINRANFKTATIPTAWALVNLSNTHRYLGNHDAMERYGQEAATEMRAVLGERHFSLVHPLALVAYGKALRRDPGAEATAREAVAVQDPLPADHFERAVGLQFLGVVLAMKGDLTEARRLLERALTLRQKQFKPPNWRLAETGGFLGEVLRRQNDPRGRALLEESLDTFARLYGPDNQRTRQAREALQKAR